MPARVPARPAVVRLGGREHCTLVAPPAPAEIAAPLTPFVIDAFDDDLEHARERRREALEARRHGGTRASSVPTVRIGEPTVNRTLAAATIKAFLGYQRGAYGACFAAARAAGMVDGTAIELEATIELDGRITGVRSRTAQAPAEAARCLAAAVAAVPMPPSDGLTRVRLTLVQAAPLGPVPAMPPQATLDEIVAGAAAAAGAGYADLAARRYGALLAQLPDDPRTCGWRVARLAALREAAPWIGTAELAEVQALAATARPADAACIAGAAEQLMSIATTPHALGVKLHRPTLLALAVARYAMLAPLAADLPNLTYYRREAEGALDR